MSKEATPLQLFKKFRGKPTDGGFFIEYLRKDEALPPYEGKAVPNAEILFKHWFQLPDDKKNRILTDLRDAHELASYPGGIEAVLAEAHFHHEDLRIIEANRTAKDTHETMIWVLAEMRHIIKNAYKFAYSDRLNSKSWYKLPGFLCKPPIDDDPVKKPLGEALSAFFMDTEGRGEKRHVEILDRRGIICYYVYLEDFARQQPGFEGDKFNPQRIRKDAYEVIFRFDPKKGSLEIYAKGVDKKHRKRLIKIFAEQCLHNTPVPDESGKAAFKITRPLEDGFNFPSRLEDGITGGRVKGIRYVLPGAEDYISVDCEGANDAQEIWKQLNEQGFDEDGNPLLNGSILNRIELGVQFTANGEEEPRERVVALSNKTHTFRLYPEDDAIRRYFEALGIIIEDAKV